MASLVAAFTPAPHQARGIGRISTKDINEWKKECVSWNMGSYGQLTAAVAAMAHMCNAMAKKAIPSAKHKISLMSLIPIQLAVFWSVESKHL